MSARHLAYMLTAFGAALSLAPAPVQAEPRAVVELFTSQGCSSCPAADKLLAEFTKDPSLIALSLSVDYWDYLGWKDTLALAGHTKRQQAYAKSRGDREVYTPQMVINGMQHVLGSDKAAIERAVTQTRRQATVLTVPVTLAVSNGKVTVNVNSSKDDRGTAEVWLCPITSLATVMVERGENRGNTMAYHNVVRRGLKVGNWTGKAESWTVPVADFSNDKDGVPIDAIDSIAVVVQGGVSTSPGVMLGAAMMPLR